MQSVICIRLAHRPRLHLSRIQIHALITQTTTTTTPLPPCFFFFLNTHEQIRRRRQSSALDNCQRLLFVVGDAADTDYFFSGFATCPDASFNPHSTHISIAAHTHTHTRARLDNSGRERRRVIGGYLGVVVSGVAAADLAIAS